MSNKNDSRRDKSSGKPMDRENKPANPPTKPSPPKIEVVREGIDWKRHNRK